MAPEPPDVSVNGSKTAMMVPIKGSIKGADFKIIDKRRKVIVTLPKAVSMVTLRVYNLKHPSFKKVWIDQDEANAQPADGTKLRFVLSQTFDPQVEITEDFVRVTIRRPESGDEPRARSTASARRSTASAPKSTALHPRTPPRPEDVSGDTLVERDAPAAEAKTIALRWPLASCRFRCSPSMPSTA